MQADLALVRQRAKVELVEVFGLVRGTVESHAALCWWLWVVADLFGLDVSGFSGPLMMFALVWTGLRLFPLTRRIKNDDSL